ncbi:protein networked 4a [Anaeramoeba flamelloides]|uniref:Protein networked 4a n=1 Tax=Anaeramoeba flamelloides TaxID=1746091 RepID=A0ABQ8Z308_9EUKA|nr:protein networked 4a [Anaeramoeba flamelloides]
MQAKESLLKRNYELTQETYSLMEKIEFLEIQNQKLVNQQIEYKKNADSLENDLISQMNNLSLGKEHKQFLIEKDSRILGGETGEILFRFNFKNFNKINTKTIYYYENDVTNKISYLSRDNIYENKKSN